MQATGYIQELLDAFKSKTVPPTFRRIKGTRYVINRAGVVRTADRYTTKPDRSDPDGKRTHDYARIGRAVPRSVDKATGKSSVVLNGWRGEGLYTMKVDRLVALTFIGVPPLNCHSVKHVDGDESNCQASNLRWAA